jgi:hypothetical protein
MAQFGMDGTKPICRVGKRNSGNTAFEKGGVEIGTNSSGNGYINFYNSTTQLVHIGYDPSNDTNNNSNSYPYYDFGIRKIPTT